MRHMIERHLSRWSRVATAIMIGLLWLVAAPRAHAASRRAIQQSAAVVAGQVIDARSRQGIGGVSVALEGTRFGAVTTDNGRFRIVNVPAGTYIAVARRLGYASQRRSVTVGSDQQVAANFVLDDAATSLDEVIITGTAGGEQRRSIGNAVATINADEAISKSAAQSLSTLVGARAPGVVIVPTTGRIGSGPSIQIRGRSSIGLDNSPLLYIDGVRVNNATFAGPIGAAGRLGGQNSNVAGRLNDISPEDIESIEIIKGPAAGTIYGTEAANGVIQIITKKGAASGKPQFNLQVQDGLLWFRDAAGRVPTNYARDPSGAIVTFNGVQSEADRGTPIFKTGQTRKYNGAVSGGRENVSYYVSGVYENDLGVEPNNSLRQFTSHANLNISPSTAIDFGTSLNFVSLSSHLGADVGVSPLLGAVAGHSLLFPSGRGFFPGFPPEVPQTLYDNAQGITRFTGSQTINHRPTSWFSHRLVAGVDYTGDDSRATERFAPPELMAIIGPVAGAGAIGQTLRRNSIISGDYSATGKFDLTSAIRSSSSLGGQFYRTELNSNFLGGTGFPGPGVETVSAVAQPATATQTQIINTTIGAYGQQQFAWRDRIFVTGALRVDNNSAFGDKFKFVTYPKVSAAWVVNEEPFFRENRVLNALKLRAAYGESGRQPVAFSALRTFSPAQGPGGTSAVTPNSIGNEDLRPERGKELEVGFDGELFRRLNLDFTYFTKRTTDLIITQPVAPSSGFAGTRVANLGRVDNRGVELLATLQALTRERVTWEIVGNIATNKDEIKDLGGIGGTVLSFGNTNVIGGPIFGYYARRVVSADRNPTTGFATNVLCDGGAGLAPLSCATAPFVFIGTPTPKVTGSVANTITLFGNLRLYGLVDFKRGYVAANNNDLVRCLGLAGAPLCRESYYPLEFDPVRLAETVGTVLAQGAVDQYIEDASFAKLRELSASYSLPTRFLLGASRGSITIAGRDLYTWTGYKGIDPEVTFGDQAITPQLTRLIATINLTF